MPVTKSPASSTSKKNSKSLDMPLQYLKGVGPKRASLFARRGICSLRDAAYYFPFRYEDRRKILLPHELRGIPKGSFVVVQATASSFQETPRYGQRSNVYELVATGKSGVQQLRCTWFHTYKGMKEKIQALLGKTIIFSGVLDFYRGMPQITHPEMESTGKTSLHWGRVVPIYSLTEGLVQKNVREVVYKALQFCLPHLEEDLPDDLRTRHGLIPVQKAIQEMHFPSSLPETTQGLQPAAHYRLLFEEFFKFHLLLLKERRERTQEAAPSFIIYDRIAKGVRDRLPFSLTKGQEKAIEEIRRDLKKAVPMQRLLQGDVGSGKTLVALLTLVEAVENGKQGALMVPTETLVEQHYQTISKLLEGTSVRLGLLKGSLQKKEKERVQKRIALGELDIVLGTHALIQEAVEWKDLGFVVVDEQQRFGVHQRSVFNRKKSCVPHILTMTATPIPRSLALTVFGPLHLSVLLEKPANRGSVITKAILGTNRQRLYNLFHREASAGRQGYLVYPLIEDSDKEDGKQRGKSVMEEYHRLKEGALKGLRLGVVHGKMLPEDREVVMGRFYRGDIDVLMSTTVIELGIDVPNATVMAVENGEYFGLSQLHQLRGRVGRGEHNSYFVLVTDLPEKGEQVANSFFSEEAQSGEGAWQRFRALEKYGDGFRIAEMDLELRGPGSFLGLRQSGQFAFRMGSIVEDKEIFEKSRLAALDLWEKDPDLTSPAHQKLRSFCERIVSELGYTLKSG